MLKSASDEDVHCVHMNISKFVVLYYVYCAFCSSFIEICKKSWVDEDGKSSYCQQLLPSLIKYE